LHSWNSCPVDVQDCSQAPSPTPGTNAISPPAINTTFCFTGTSLDFGLQITPAIFEQQKENGPE